MLKTVITTVEVVNQKQWWISHCWGQGALSKAGAVMILNVNIE